MFLSLSLSPLLFLQIHVNTLMQSIQLGIQHSIGVLSQVDPRDLLMQDFMTVETVTFPKGGSSTTPAHACADFTFKTVAPLAFRYFLNLFGIRREDFMVRLFFFLLPSLFMSALCHQ